jgi:hypothetical protein
MHTDDLLAELANRHTTVAEAVDCLCEKAKWIQKAIKRPGALRKALGVKEGENIPLSALQAAAKKKGRLGRQARLALAMRKMKKK